MPSQSLDEKAVFNSARQIEDAAERDSYLARACGDDRKAIDRIRELLRIHELEQSFLEAPPPGVGATADLSRTAENPGTVIGPYKLIEQIGEGGFGIVYLAEQREPVRRQVALKIIKPGMDTRAVAARFEAERQALALMDHPHIAKVFDAGSTQGGRPYFVMELVKGIPITDYCDRANVTTQDRLELFLAVCQAVQHAHQKGIIHRDLKPTNVMIAMQDGQAVPKVIDFGVAKATNVRLTEHTLHTCFTQMVGTPMYMSPEQAEMSPLEIDTRSDIYSLGVLLYELLTGATPFDKDRLSAVGYDELRRIIREEEPPMPSTRLSTMDAAALSTIAEHRRTDPRRLSQLVRGDLDWIVMKALDKDRSRRYETAIGFARDVERYLHEEPVEACPPSAAYRFGKFARRNRVPLLAAAVVFLAIVLGWGVMTVVIARERNAAQAAAERERQAAEQAARERQRAEENLRKARAAVDRVFTRAAEELRGQPHMEKIRRRLLLDALEFYQGFLKQKSQDPTIRYETARAYRRVGDIHLLLGQLDRAEKAFLETAKLLAALSSKFPAVPDYRDSLADAHAMLSTVYAPHLTSRPEPSLKHALAALETRQKLAADFPNRPEFRRQVAGYLAETGMRYQAYKDIAAAEKYLTRAVAQWQQIQRVDSDDPGVLQGLAFAHHWLGALYLSTLRFDEAESQLRQALAIREGLLEARPDDVGVLSDIAHNKAYVANALVKTGGRPEDAAELRRQAIAIREKLLDQYPNVFEHWRRLRALYGEMAHDLARLGRHDEAVAMLQRSIEHQQKLAAHFPELNGGHRSLGWSHFNLGLLLHAIGRSQEAADAFRQALAAFQELAPASADRPGSADPLAWFLVACPASQFREPQRSVELAKRQLQHLPQDSNAWNTLGVAHYRLGDLPAAVEALEKGIQIRGKSSPVDLFVLAICHWKLGDQEKAKQLYNEACSRHCDGDQRVFREEAAELLGSKEEAETDESQE